MKTVWLLEEDLKYAGTLTIGTYTSRKRAYRAMREIAREIAEKRDVKVPVFGAPERDPDSGKITSRKAVEYECHDTKRGTKYTARKVPVNERAHIAQ